MKSQSMRKLIGTILLVVFLALYGFVMFVFGMALAAQTTSQIAALSFYALAGLGWVVPAGWIIKWAFAPPPRDGGRA